MKPLFILLIFILLAGCAGRDRYVGEQCHTNQHTNYTFQATLEQDLYALTSPAFNGRKTGTQGAALTRNYLTTRFEQSGLHPWQGSFYHSFSYRKNFSDKQGINLVAFLPASKQQIHSSWRLILAHYDHLGGKITTDTPDASYYPGADDNASGVVAMLAIAAQLKHVPRTHNLIFVATDAEEPGLYGSKALVPALDQAGILKQIDLVINLDMVGRPDNHRRLYIEGMQSLPAGARKQTMERLQLAYQATGLCTRVGHLRGMGRGSFVSDRIDWIRASDHYPFHQNKISWLFLGSGQHDQYHTELDTPDLIDINFLSQVIQLTSTLADAPQAKFPGQ